MSLPVTSLVGLPELIKNCMVNVESSTHFDANYSVHGIRLNYNNYVPPSGSAVGFTSHGWCSGYLDGNQYITCGSSSPIEYFAVSTQGRGDYDQWVTGYTIKYSYDGVKYFDYNGGSVIAANSDRNTIVTHYFSKPFLARSVRLFAKTYNGRASMRMELYGKPSNATAPPPSPATPFFTKKVNLRNLTNDAYVRNNNGVIDLSASKKKLEEWTVEDAGGDKIRLLNTQFKKYLSSDATDYISHATNAVAADVEWTIAEIRPNVFTFANQNGKLLKGTSSYDCEATGVSGDPETEFEITTV